VGAADSMEFKSILVSKALPDGTFSQKAVIDTRRTITSSNDLRDSTAGTIRSSRGKVDACVYTRESVCREAASFETGIWEVLVADHAAEKSGTRRIRRFCTRFGDSVLYRS
jgi:hypothetical protein